MKLRLSLVTAPGESLPILVTADGTATIAAIASAIQAGYSQVPVPSDQTLTLQTLDDEGDELSLLPARSTLIDNVLYSGQRIRVVLWRENSTGHDSGSSAPARLHILSSPDSTQAGRAFSLRPGPNIIGRDSSCDVTVNDQMASRQHARLIVGDRVEITDMNSSNGVVVGDALVDHAVLGPRDTVLIGETRFVVERNPELIDSQSSSIDLEFNRSPLVRSVYQGREFQAPKPPSPAKPGRFPLVAMVAPLLMGAVLFAATHRALALVFVCISPVMAIGTWLDRRYTNRKDFNTAQSRFGEELEKLTEEIGAALDEEHLARCAETPSVQSLLQAAFSLNPELWHRRPDDPDFLSLNLGYGRTESRHTVIIPERGDAVAETWSALSELKDQCAEVNDVPIVADLRQSGNLGIAGPRDWLDPVTGNLFAQIACLHSPAEVTVAAIASAESCGRWSWLMWLPHVGSQHSPLGGSHLASAPGEVSALVSALEELVAARQTQRAVNGHIPAVVLLVENDAPVERGRLVALAERGPTVGVHLIWVAERQDQLPAACQAYLVRDRDRTTATAGFVKEGRTAAVTRVEQLTGATAELLSRRLAPLLDAGAPVLDQSDLPRAISYLSLAGTELASDPGLTVERWREAGSLRDQISLRHKTPATLRGLIGQGSHGEFQLDLRTQGPHALVGGTTGAGKSEFLQSWILGMAAAHSPYRVTFLFVDYKGGAAFADCVQLPHTVGLVTDLSQHLVRRALTSLRAELHYRERLLNAKKAKDLIALERTGDPDCPPSLIIVVDEFAALVQEVPDFVDGVVDVAQRGRSLGLHLILATQRPAGVIKDNLRANTNLRIALRMADESDSDDVIGTTMAAEFDPRIPGRGAVRTGPGRIALFQAGYAGGRTSHEPEPPRIDVETMVFGQGSPWEIPVVTTVTSTADDEGPTDIARIVQMVKQAAERCQIEEPRKPWLPELEPCIDLEALLAKAPALPPEAGSKLVIGLVDDPAAQAQQPVLYDPDKDGNLAVYGTGGSGKSGFLRTVAVMAGLQSNSGRTEIYGLDFGSGGLAMLAEMPHVGAIIEGSDNERVTRLLRRLTTLLDDRTPRFSAARAGSITEYRQVGGHDDEARIIVLLDGFSAFREAYEGAIGRTQYYAMVTRLLAEGRAVGIHVLVSADRQAAIPNAVAAHIQRRLVLRQTDENAYMALGVARDILGPESPPGRAVFAETDNEIQIAIPGGSPSPADQSAAIDTIAQRLRDQGVPEAEPVERLTTFVRMSDLPVEASNRPVIGLWDETLAPLSFNPQGAFIVAGQPGSGRTTVLRALTQIFRRWRPELPLYYFGPRRSSLKLEGCWNGVATEPEMMKELAAEIKPLVEEPANDEPSLVIMVEAVNELVQTPPESAVAEIIKLAKRNGHCVIGEAETANWGSTWPIVSEIRNSHRGLILQPDHANGDALFKVTFPRPMKRTDHPAGRAIFVDAGKFYVLQLPIPD
ncbi:MAG: FHA domain-containing protein [Propionibacteriaceae bacterium]|jgi:S-DNA-T family DNA segregation ATPase FtsK/SpoIIIE|nr:FHA domain-containing protein [Propionibacteriaceae bacterium]